MQLYAKKPEKKEKDEFVNYIIRKYDRHWLPKKEFYAEFAKWKQEKRRKEHEKGDIEDDLPF